MKSVTMKLRVRDRFVSILFTSAFGTAITFASSGAHAQEVSSRSLASQQDAHLLEKDPGDPNGLPDRGASFGAHGGGGAYANAPPTGTATTTTEFLLPIAFVGVDAGYHLSSYVYLGVYASFGYVPERAMNQRFAIDVDYHPLGAASISPRLGFAVGYELMDFGGAFAELPVGSDLCSTTQTGRWGLYLAPSVGKFSDASAHAAHAALSLGIRAAL
jgi:hypothetical protein